MGLGLLRRCVVSQGQDHKAQNRKGQSHKGKSHKGQNHKGKKSHGPKASEKVCGKPGTEEL